jgi:hypothetical protein
VLEQLATKLAQALLALHLAQAVVSKDRLRHRGNDRDEIRRCAVAEGAGAGSSADQQAAGDGRCPQAR